MNSGPPPPPAGSRPDEERTAASATPMSGSRSIFVRMGGNALWLLGSRGFTGVASIGYLAFASRALGPTGFGVFSLVLAYGGSFAALAQFRSWQAVIRYGAIHRADGRPDRLARLVGFTATLDYSSALIGVLLAWVGVAVAGALLGLAAEQQWRAALFTAVLLLTTGATPTGVLRLFNRYDLLSLSEATGPAVRLVGAAIVWAAGGGITPMLAAWALAAVLENAAQWTAALAIRRTGLSFGPAAFRAAAGENPRIWSYMIQNSFASSLGLLGERAGTLVVGGEGGAVAAGAFRVSSKLAGALAKPADAITRALFPELVQLATTGDRATLRRVALQTTAIASIVGAAMVGVVWLTGPTLLRVVFGEAFAFAQPYLLLLTVAAAIDLWGLAFEPILNAHGRSGRVLGARTIGALAYVGTLLVLLPLMGPISAAIAAIATALALRGGLALSAFGLLREAAAHGDRQPRAD